MLIEGSLHITIPGFILLEFFITGDLAIGEARFDDDDFMLEKPTDRVQWAVVNRLVEDDF